MWKCPFCETINEDKVCAVCGELRPMPPAKTESNNNQPVSAPESTPAMPPYSGVHTDNAPLDPTPTLSNSPKKSKKKKTWIWIVAVIVVLALIGFAVIIANYRSESSIENVKVGDYITFGKYEIDDRWWNGKEDIEWLVLAKDGNKVLVTSKYALDREIYGEGYEVTTWAECTLRAWLNDEFYNTAFSESEKAQIQSISVLNNDNPSYGTDGGIDTYDKVFLLSIEEAYKYFNSDRARECKPTLYTAEQNLNESDNGNCEWWLRSPGSEQSYATWVGIDGVVDEGGGETVNDGIAVRPAMWITLE